MTILDQIVADKRLEVAATKHVRAIATLEQSGYFKMPCHSLTKQLTAKDQCGIIAEIKRRSPSKGDFKSEISVETISNGYLQAGASALSILTDNKYFGGSIDDVLVARRVNRCPILRKEFIIDEFQIIEAKSIGADVILLIAAILSPKEIQQFSATARDLGLEILLEVHSEEELKRSLCDSVHAIGVNNRDLRDFSVDIERSIALAPFIPPQFVKVAESGISTASTIRTLRSVGFQGFLMGEAFMAHPDPAVACKNLIAELR